MLVWEGWQTKLTHLCLNQQFFTRFISRYIFRELEARGFQSNNSRKDVDRYNVWSIGNNLIDNLCKSHIILIDVHSKRSSTRCFQGHDLHHQVTGFAHAFSFIFFSLRLFFQFLQFKGANFYTKIMQRRIEVTVLFLEPKSIFQRLFKLHGPFIEKQYHVLGIRARLFAWLRDFARSTGCPVQYWGITLRLMTRFNFFSSFK